eukprot:2852663-Prymnesium_polylepis.1
MRLGGAEPQSGHVGHVGRPQRARLVASAPRRAQQQCGSAVSRSSLCPGLRESLSGSGVSGGAAVGVCAVAVQLLTRLPFPPRRSPQAADAQQSRRASRAQRARSRTLRRLAPVAAARAQAAQRRATAWRKQFAVRGRRQRCLNPSRRSPRFAAVGAASTRCCGVRAASPRRRCAASS